MHRAYSIDICENSSTMLVSFVVANSHSNIKSVTTNINRRLRITAVPGFILLALFLV